MTCVLNVLVASSEVEKESAGLIREWLCFGFWKRNMTVLCLKGVQNQFRHLLASLDLGEAGKLLQSLRIFCSWWMTSGAAILRLNELNGGVLWAKSLIVQLTSRVLQRRHLRFKVLLPYYLVIKRKIRFCEQPHALLCDHLVLF